MLKLQVHKREFKSDLIKIDYDEVIAESMEIEYEIVENNETIAVSHDPRKEQLLVTCSHSDNLSIHVGDRIVGSYTITNSDGYDVTNTQYFTVNGVDDVTHSFTFLADKYIDLNGNTFSYGKTFDYVSEGEIAEEEAYVYLYLDRNHLFSDYDDGNGVIVYFADDEGNEAELVGEPFGDKCIRFPLKQKQIQQCDREEGEELTPEQEYCAIQAADTIAFNQSVVNKNRPVVISMLKYYDLVDYNENDWDTIYDEVFTEDILSEERSALPFRFRQYNVMFENTLDNEKLTLSLVRPSVSIAIPLTSKIATDLNQETDVNDKYVEVEKKKAINPYVEMEKDVYVPKYKDGNTLKNVTELHFNLHFRKRTGDDWKVVKNASWNGVKSDRTLMNESNKDNYGFFSYTDKSSQSDLLTYLSFADSDVKYRKNTLKKSFLRLSFFDSTLLTNQNLLCYSTIFVDTGNLFAKYMRNFDNPKKPDNTFGFSRMIDGGESMKKKLSGSRVNREPYWTTYPTDDNEIEKLRLSSQFVVKDKYSSDSCSEGFYLYLWKNNNNGNMPSDIYMRVEFNHAGFGRTIPFMLPYDKATGEIKDFDTVADDNGYGVKEYIRYSYIHFKYKQCDDGKYVYYLDDGQYTSNISFKDGVLSLNLYEAKLSDEGD